MRSASPSRSADPADNAVNKDNVKGETTTAKSNPPMQTSADLTQLVKLARMEISAAICDSGQSGAKESRPA